MKRVFILFMAFIFGVTLVGCKTENVGRIHSLKEAYELKLLSKEDLESIAYYYNQLDNNEFIPKPKNPESISKTNQKLIKKAYLNDVLEEPNKSIKKVYIYDYYGTYNNYIVIGVTDSYYCYDYLIEDEYILDGISFYKFHVAAIRVYVSN